MSTAIHCDSMLVCHPDETDFIEELLSSADDFAKSINMDLPTNCISKHCITQCGTCGELNLFHRSCFGKGLLGVCDYCEGEFIL